MARRYPLEPLVGIRREKTDKRAQELARARAKSEREQRVLAEAKERRARLEAGTRLELAHERTRLEQGELTARDLQQAERHRAGAAQRLGELSVLEREAARRAKEALVAEAGARSALGIARAEAKAVERHRQRFRAAEARAEQEAEQEAAEERHGALRQGERGD